MRWIRGHGNEQISNSRSWFCRNINVSIYKEIVEIRVGVPRLYRTYMSYFPAGTAHAWSSSASILTYFVGDKHIGPASTTTTMTTTRIDRSHVRIFVFGWDHVWIKWQHGSPTDADISVPCARRRHEYTHSAGQLGTWTDILSMHTNTLWIYLSTLFFIITASRMRQR